MARWFPTVFRIPVFAQIFLAPGSAECLNDEKFLTPVSLFNRGDKKSVHTNTERVFAMAMNNMRQMVEKSIAGAVVDYRVNPSTQKNIMEDMWSKLASEKATKKKSAVTKKPIKK